jgi:3-mercaptopyruvate sulfurtransferase SseA
MMASDTLVMRDGTTHSGTFVSATSATITFREGKTLHRYSRSKEQSLQFGESATSAKASATTANAKPALPALPRKLPLVDVRSPEEYRGERKYLLSQHRDRGRARGLASSNAV